MLANNYQLCLNGFKKLKERLRKTPQLLHEYNKVFDEYLNLGIIEKLKMKEMQVKLFIYPQGSYKKGQIDSKVKNSCRCECENKDISSLNEVLYKGPCLNVDLYSLLLKFPIQPIAITADIERLIYKSVLTMIIDTFYDFCDIAIFSNKLFISTGLLELFQV